MHVEYNDVHLLCRLAEDSSLSIIYTRELNTTSETGKINEPKLKHKLEKLKLDHTGFNDLVFYVEGAPATDARAHVIPAWLSLLPPMATLAVAVTLKQVLLALLLGIWIGVYRVHPV